MREGTGVIKLGFVQELHTFYDAIDVALNPMVGGTGLKIKTVEPLCYGKPVLTTLPGAQGLTHPLDLTVSIGVACSEGTNDSAQALLKRADEALYEAKRDGRNRVVADAA